MNNETRVVNGVTKTGEPMTSPPDIAAACNGTVEILDMDNMNTTASDSPCRDLVPTTKNGATVTKACSTIGVCCTQGVREQLGIA